jgi:hypothetical protein
MKRCCKAGLHHLPCGKGWGEGKKVKYGHKKGSYWTVQAGAGILCTILKRALRHGRGGLMYDKIGQITNCYSAETSPDG